MTSKSKRLRRKKNIKRQNINNIIARLKKKGKVSPEEGEKSTEICEVFHDPSSSESKNDSSSVSEKRKQEFSPLKRQIKKKCTAGALTEKNLWPKKTETLCLSSWLDSVENTSNGIPGKFKRKSEFVDSPVKISNLLNPSKRTKNDKEPIWSSEKSSDKETLLGEINDAETDVASSSYFDSVLSESSSIFSPVLRSSGASQYDKVEESENTVESGIGISNSVLSDIQKDTDYSSKEFANAEDKTAHNDSSKDEDVILENTSETPKVCIWRILPTKLKSHVEYLHTPKKCSMSFKWPASLSVARFLAFLRWNFKKTVTSLTKVFSKPNKVNSCCHCQHKEREAAIEERLAALEKEVQCLKLLLSNRKSSDHSVPPPPPLPNLFCAPPPPPPPPPPGLLQPKITLNLSSKKQSQSAVQGSERPSITVEDILKVQLKKTPRTLGEKVSKSSSQCPVISVEMLKSVKLRSSSRNSRLRRPTSNLEDSREVSPMVRMEGDAVNRTFTRSKVKREPAVP